MSDSSSPSPSLAESINDAKRVENDVLTESPREDELLDDVPESEKDTVLVRSLDTDDNEVFKLRAYQDEMLAESLKRNTIIVLNTGAGKTHIALARARAELEMEQLDKLVWFLAPTVALCHQHYRSITTNLPAYQTRLLTSEDGVDRWTDQTVWDGVLKDMKVIVSTYGVLYDALCHGFVTMQRLSLCVFDEAHHCTKNHASNMIMKHFYRPAKDNGYPVPRILGLSASPVMTAKAGGLEILEANMDSHAITPRLHRSELMQYVHIPELLKRTFESKEAPNTPNSLREALTTAIHLYKIREDPYLVEIMQTGGPDMKGKVDEVLMSRKTYCTDQLRALRKRAEVIARDISPSAAETYIQACRDKFLAGVQEDNNLWMPELSDKEKSHLAEILTNLRVDAVSSDTTVSFKLRLLLDILKEESGSSFTGIIFVEQRAVVAALAEFLSSDPECSQIFNIGTFVGGSNSSKKKSNIGDINDLKAQQQTLDDYRVGKKNLIIATSVLEEGIDISSCQTVICFDAPLNLVSFVQRRGRARKKDSKYIILLADGDDKGEPAKWHQLEERMKAAYEDEYRNAQLAVQLEQTHETEDRKYKVQKTGALLTLDNAKSHLNHFCATLQTANHVDHRPVFECRTDAEDLITAKVLLPSSVSQKYRTAVSAHSWKTERAAMKDAAFQACVALHRGGLLNDHLLPPHIQTPDQARQNRPSLVKVAMRHDPWELGTTDLWFKHVVELKIEGQPSIPMAMFLPVECPKIDDIALFWSMHITGVANIGPGQPCKLSEEEANRKQKDTESMLLSVFAPADLASVKGRYAAMFEPLDQPSVTPLSRKTRPAIEQLSRVQNATDVGLVQVSVQQGRSYVFQSIQGQDQEILEVTKFPKKRDFLTRPAEESKKDRLTRETFAMAQCTINVLPARYSFFAACIPSILHRVETAVLAARLQNTLLKPVGIENLQLIIEATTSGAANFTASYERLEYLGDAVLKYCTHVQLAAQHPEWPESYLTAEKGRTNGNASLSRAALSSGVDRFISTTKFTGNHWKPPILCTDQKDKNDQTVDRSTKTLADVVEALIGAAYMDKCLQGALACIRIFLPNEQWLDHTTCLSSLLSQTPALSNVPPFLDTVETLIDYKFANPSLLLEALTHSSFSSPEALSYERLEFLGDAILDQILVPTIFSATPALKNHEMHRMRQALANAHILGICCLELSLPVSRLEPTTNQTGEVGLEEAVHLYHLHDFLRCGPSIHVQRKAALDRYIPLRTQILEQLEHGHEYPWPDLLRLGLHKSCKWMSDILESVLGAIYIDSSGNLSACKAFVGKLGLFKLFDRFLDEGVQVGFPRERLGLMANQKDVEYVASSDGNGEWSCKIFVGQKEVVDVGGCVSREEAKVRGAATAVRVLQEEIIRGMESIAVDGGEDEDMVDAE
ncbi:P-loop containing nucleoside triphosphate hydrolase protein [Aureobasidium melanogenum CBS 110374]|uniref:p-loop containing nucleoside triphosphate hydrolase protein n=1 Tax=Aureobasidium melanogenum (strain CBS 110374) TaxID=1043003 RepID=A0A074WTS2_AURM1|nr:P-loop containing nucleoside triphosphate hydrolase protein [Aureobasidium melanogenum CBS 110374]KEQ65816.1 P-loop containing nucleoside triphosphate hydrolase protein [Aureobasidium melanogenum CBS 110374]